MNILNVYIIIIITYEYNMNILKCFHQRNLNILSVCIRGKQEQYSECVHHRKNND